MCKVKRPPPPPPPPAPPPVLEQVAPKKVNQSTEDEINSKGTKGFRATNNTLGIGTSKKDKTGLGVGR